MPDEPIKPLVPRRRHKNVIEAPIPPAIVGEVVDNIERRLKFVQKVTFVLEFAAGLYILYWFSTTNSISTVLRLYGLILTAVYCVVVLFGRLQRMHPGRLGSVFSVLWLASACTTVAYHGRPEIPIIIGGVLTIAYSLMGDRSFSKQVSMAYVLMSTLWLATYWAFPVATDIDTAAVKVTGLLIAVVVVVVFLSSRVAGVQAARIFGDSIAGLEDMQQALAQVHNRQIRTSREAGRDVDDDDDGRQEVG